MTYTFGFEAEFDNSVESITRHLNLAGYCRNPNIHNYTCGCDNCCFDGDDPSPLRTKHDSSCGGEVISRILDTDSWPEAVELMLAIQNGAVETDTMPGLSAGFHVHVGKRHLRPVSRGRLIYGFSMWEDAFTTLAAGRWPDHRGWNQTMVNVMGPHLDNWLTDQEEKSWGDLRWMSPREKLLAVTPSEDFYRFLDVSSGAFDRHSSLALLGRHPTVEFRLWNSTRSAWRMELWCRMSCLMADPDYTKGLVSLVQDDVEPTFENLGYTLIAHMTDDRLMELFQRQVDYLNRLHSESTADNDFVLVA